MSSLNFKKLKQNEPKHLMRHCDKAMRLKSEHSNVHINKELTMKNEQLRRSYEDTCKLLDDTLEELDRRPNANHRVDRVVTYAIEGPLPMPVDDDEITNRKKSHDWVRGIVNILKEEYPEIEVLQEYIHYDEVHEYVNAETKERVMSRPHVHLFVVPIVEGKLNSKKFFPSKKSFYEFNKKLDDLTMNIYGKPYGDGTKKKSLSTVEKLKIESEKAELEQRKKMAEEMESDLISRETALRQQERIFEEQEQKFREKESKLAAFMESDIGRRAIQEYKNVMRNGKRSEMLVGQRERNKMDFSVI